MAPMLSDRPERTLSNPVRADLEGIRGKDRIARTDAKNLDKSAKARTLRALAREAMRLTGLSNKAFAIAAGQSESVISEAMTGTRHLASEWLWDQADDYIVCLMHLMKAERGLDDDERAKRIDDELTFDLMERLLRRRKAVNA